MTAPRTILITGATGLLGPYLIDSFSRAGTVVATSRSGGDIAADLSSDAEVDTLLRTVRPDLLVHAAALTDVDRCEREPDNAMAMNADVPARLVRSLAPAAMVLALSTDQVYPDRSGPHREDASRPVNAYGRTKLLGEAPVLGRGDLGLVVRTNFFGRSRTAGRSSLSDFIADSLSAARSIVLFEDVLFSPLHAKTLSDVLVEMVDRGASGVFNLGSRDGCSKLTFGQKVACHLGLPLDSATAGRSTDIPGRASRPLDLRMNVSRAEAVLKRALPTIDDEVHQL